MVAWTCLPADARDVFRHVLTVDDATWSRGRGWALQFGLMAAAYPADNPVLGNIVRHTVAEVLADFGQACLPRSGAAAQTACVRVARQPDASAAAASVSRTVSRMNCSGQYWLAGW